MATWLIKAQFQLSKLYWIPEKIVKRNGSVLLKPSRFHAQTFLDMGHGPLQSRVLYMAEMKWEVAH
jgi:hypothetical protein